MFYFFIFLILVVSITLGNSTVKGKMGEAKVKSILKQLNPEQYIPFHDLYIPINNHKKTSQVDHVLLSAKGIFVIETKNYKGWITGTEHSQTWNQTIYNSKHKFPNPIRQNYGHIQALKELLGDWVETVPFYSIIVFTDRAELKFNTEFKNAIVIKTNRLINVIEICGKDIVIEKPELNKIQRKLERLTKLNSENKKKLTKKHKTEVRSTLEKKKKNIDQNICPKCGGPLIVRKGKYGEFRGCGNYPKCKFTA